MRRRVGQITSEVESRVIGYRRDFHRHAEAAWTEFRTSSLVARRLASLGYDVQGGRQVLRDEDRMGLPSPDTLEKHWQCALEQGGDREFLEVVKGGFTGVVGILDNGPGPVVGLRFDMDAVDISESQDSGHRPFREGFASVNDGASHACGHDGHTAVGLGVAEVLMSLRDQVRGTVKLIFQPAEEGVRGAKAMVSAGVVDDVDYVLGHHLYSRWKLGEIDPGRGDYLATTKFDAYHHRCARACRRQASRRQKRASRRLYGSLESPCHTQAQRRGHPNQCGQARCRHRAECRMLKGSPDGRDEGEHQRVERIHVRLCDACAGIRSLYARLCAGGPGDGQRAERQQ